MNGVMGCVNVIQGQKDLLVRRRVGSALLQHRTERRESGTFSPDHESSYTSASKEDTT